MDWKTLAIGLVMILVLLYGFGTLINRQRSLATMRWLIAGAKRMGKPGGLRWRGRMHSAGRLDVTDLRPPYSQMELIFVLERRGNLPVWIYKHLKGQRDELFVRADLRALPDPEIETGPQGSSSVKKCLAQPDGSYQRKEEGGAFDIAWRGQKNNSALARVQKLMEKYPRANLRISLQRTSPHLALRVNLGGLLRQSPEQFFDDLREAVR